MNGYMRKNEEWNSWDGVLGGFDSGICKWVRRGSRRGGGMVCGVVHLRVLGSKWGFGRNLHCRICGKDNFCFVNINSEYDLHDIACRSGVFGGLGARGAAIWWLLNSANVAAASYWAFKCSCVQAHQGMLLI